MGQAKKRGTFEQRKADAVEREAKEHAERAARMQIRRPRSKSNLAALLAILAGSTIGGPNVG
jgi:hypothetical protein